MDEGQVEGFVAAAERDYDAMVRVYRALVTGPVGLDVDEVRDARADVLAAQQVLLLARSEEEQARQTLAWGHGGARGMAEGKRRMAEMERVAQERPGREEEEGR